MAWDGRDSWRGHTWCLWEVEKHPGKENSHQLKFHSNFQTQTFKQNAFISSFKWNAVLGTCMDSQKAFIFSVLMLPFWPEKASREDGPRPDRADTARVLCRAHGLNLPEEVVSSRRSSRWLHAGSCGHSGGQWPHPHRSGAGSNRSSRAHSYFCSANSWCHPQISGEEGEKGWD